MPIARAAAEIEPEVCTLSRRAALPGPMRAPELRTRVSRRCAMQAHGITRIACMPLDLRCTEVLQPMSHMGQTEKNSMRANVFRFAPESGHRAMQSACPFRAKARNRCAIARCAGARAEGPVAVERTAIAGWQGQHDQQACCWRATRDRTRLVSSLRPATSSAAPITQ
jgi:hypothetical protein